MPTRFNELPADIVDALAIGKSLLTAEAARFVGISAGRVHRLSRAGLLVRVATGVYASRAELTAATPWQAFTLRSRAFVLACGPSVSASGWSAAALLGLPVVSDPPSLPQAAAPRQVGHPLNSPYGKVRTADLPASHCVISNGVSVTSLARTVVDLGRTSPRPDALVIADSALARGLPATHLHDVLASQAGWDGIREAAWVVDHADAYAETPLETLGRLAFIEGGLPIPISNAWIDLGALRYRPDHLLDDLWEVFEGDGAQKYDGRLDAGAVIAKQREREWHLREAGYEIGVRYGYREARYERPKLAQRLRAAIASRRPRSRRAPWYRDPRTYRGA